LASVELRFSPLPAHVRTARLVAVAAARRIGVDEDALDEIRLAVGEAAARAVRRHQAHECDDPVVVSLSDEGTFVVEVSDRVPGSVDTDERPMSGSAGFTAVSGGDGVFPSGVDLAVIAGLVEDVTVTSGPGGSVVRMCWPLRPRVD